ncbi:methyltransferase-like 26 isoform X2 [Planococcus citri]|uniref:methyltransferase-like 26 isoform X2 n=1 Tax=Planococcus citri TaxID=170843 RepID=UPI0031F75F44
MFVGISTICLSVYHITRVVVDSAGPQAERMLNFAAAERNKQPILDVLKNYIKDGTRLLEIASGSGQHVTHFARHFTNVTFQPTEYHSSLINSILAYKDHFNLPNVLPAKYLNVEDDPDNWLNGDLAPESVDYIYNSNMIHITPYSCTEGLFRGCGRYLKGGGLVFLYGPFAYNGLITPSSNVEFDKGLRSSDPSYGLRDVIRQLVPEASKYRIRLETQHQLPSNNQLLVWKKDEM